MNFNAAVLIKKNKIEILKLSFNNLSIGQCVIKILYSSICHTQLQEIEGLRGFDKFLPHCLGHEAVGIVVDKHPSVKKVKANDYVCLSWINTKGINSGGTNYLYQNKIKVNAGPVNTFSEYALISENKIYKIRKDKSFKQKVLLGCALPTAYNAINDLEVDKINSICIIGCGGLGISSIIAAKDYNIKNITAIDRNPYKLKIAKANGANILFNDISKIDKQKSFDVIVECTGNLNVLQNCINYSKNFGGKVIVIGNYPKGKLIKIDPWRIINGNTLMGAWNDSANFEKKFYKFEKKIKNKNLSFFFGRKTYNLNSIDNAIKDFKEGKIIRPLLKLF